VIYNSLSIHSQCFKGNENEENFWFDDPWNASMEEAVPAKWKILEGRYRGSIGKCRDLLSEWRIF
jgi:hypothetical protein